MMFCIRLFKRNAALILPFLAIISLSLTASAQSKPAPAQTLSTNLASFGIPFQVNADDGSFVEVQLYVSKDKGRSWTFYSRQATNKPEFPFRATGEGEYWFSLKTLDRNRNLLPPGKPQPELKIVVDQTKPTLDFRIETDRAGRVACRWDARDTFLNTDSFKILYRADAVDNPNTKEAQWNTVPVQLNKQPVNGRYSDQVAWWPETSSELLTVRISIADNAGNTTYSDRQIRVPQVAWRNKSKSTARPYDTAKRDTVSPTAQSKPFAAEPICKDGVCRVPDFPSFDIPDDSRTANQQPPTQLPAKSLSENEVPPLPFEKRSKPPVTNQAPTEANLAQSNANNPSPEEQSIEWKSASASRNDSKTTSTGSTNEIAKQAPQIPVVPSDIAPRPGQAVNTQSDRTASNSNSGSTPVGQSKVQDDQFISESTTRKRTPSFIDRELHKQLQQGPQVTPGNGSGNLPQQGRAQGAPQSHPNGINAASARRIPPSDANSVLNRAKRPPYQTHQLNQSQMPAVANTAQPINSRRFQLNYGIDAIDPSGVQRVDLWMTRDSGRTWHNWGTDPDSVSPFPVEVKEQGVYGFRVVIQSRDGLSGRPPMQGEQPDILIQVDTDAPRIHISSVPYGRGNDTGRLVINWQAADPLLALRPITLAYSSTATGPWTIIEKGIRNEGRYAWKVGTEVPEKIFLRAEAIDRAGNVGIYQLPNQIDISGLVPRAHIHSVQPVGQQR